ncbi:hypothetical protein GCM10009104_03800 [Marinobacterium maritimum]|uniref:DUF1330 domain-containing protein n=1 Tax=Marinobacterium maritimum TaxID=500162 RepID=A0ABP3T898_9GAMM
MNCAYVIGHVTVKDSRKWQQYRNQVPATLEPWGAELMFRGKIASVLSGKHEHSDTVVIRFPGIEKVTGWYESPQYQSLIPLREQAADMELLVFEE